MCRGIIISFNFFNSSFRSGKVPPSRKRVTLLLFLKLMLKMYSKIIDLFHYYPFRVNVERIVYNAVDSHVAINTVAVKRRAGVNAGNTNYTECKSDVY